MQRLIGLTLVCLVGCSGLTTEQAAVKAKLVKNAGTDPLEFVRWWQVDIKDVDVPGYLAIRKEEHKTLADDPVTERVDRMQSDFDEMIIANPKTKTLVRVQYRYPDKEAKMILEDVVFSVNGDKTNSGATVRDYFTTREFRLWLRRVFPET